MRAGMPSLRRRPPAHRVRCERIPREGMLLQVDGSHHAEAQAVLVRFLPRFNGRFAVAAREAEPALALDPALDLDAILAFRRSRTVARKTP